MNDTGNIFGWERSLIVGNVLGQNHVNGGCFQGLGENDKDRLETRFKLEGKSSARQTEPTGLAERS